MRKTALAGAFALAMVGTFSFSPLGLGVSPAFAQEITVTEGQIASLHAALHLTPAQERNWYPVAATLRRLGHAQAQYQVASAESGFVERTRNRVAGYTVTAMTMGRLRSAAQPLIASLSEEQKDAGRNALASMGVSF
jgi:LTXXQ motif family protein